MARTVPPDSPLTRDDPDILVIGGGIVGLFCAYHLRRRGADVTIVERGTVGGPQSCSYGNTGFVGTQGAVPLAEPGVLGQGLRWLLDPESPFHIRPRWDPELLSWLWHFRRACTEEAARAGFRVLVGLKRRSLDMLRELSRSDRLATSFTASGMVLAFRTPQGFDKACRLVPQAVEHGVPLRVLDPGELRDLEPDADFDIHGALYNEDGAGLHVPDFVIEFGRMLRDMGVEIREHAEVRDFEISRGMVARVDTTYGELRPREVVLAAGAWSARCARKLGVGLKLQPAKGYSVTVTAPRGGPHRPLLLGEGKVALMPLGDRLRIAGTLELAGMDTAISMRRVAGIMRTVHTYLPRLERTETVEMWSGFRPCTPDGLPFIGRAGPYPNLSVACGHGHIGMGLAPAGGELIAQIITGEQLDTDVAPLRPDRFGNRRRRLFLGRR
jgi:D-amino-acid dehydrogenase